MIRVNFVNIFIQVAKQYPIKHRQRLTGHIPQLHHSFHVHFVLDLISSIMAQINPLNEIVPRLVVQAILTLFLKDYYVKGNNDVSEM